MRRIEKLEFYCLKKREYKYDQRLLLAYMGNAIMKMLCAINIWQ